MTSSAPGAPAGPAPALPAPALPTPAPGTPGLAPLDLAALDRVEAAIAEQIRLGHLPGAVVHVERRQLSWRRAIGHKALDPAREALALDTIYDCASLTKAVVTAPVMARLMQTRTLTPETRVRALLPAFTGGDGVTLRHLLTHSSSLPASLPLDFAWSGADEALALACISQPTHAPGSLFRYSDINFVLLGAIAQRVTGLPLDVLALQWLFQPLAMQHSGYLPLQRFRAADIAPTEWAEGGRMLRGQVHDPTARRMGGVAGHAGLFSTAADLARYARMLLQGGELDGVRVLDESSVRRMTAVATPAALPERRSLGWDIDSPFSRPRGKLYPLGSFGHTGFTGCALWIDPYSSCFHLMLSNRVHPRTNDTIVALYEQVATLVAQSVQGFDFQNVPGALPRR